MGLQTKVGKRKMFLNKETVLQAKIFYNLGLYVRPNNIALTLNLDMLELLRFTKRNNSFLEKVYL